MTFTAKTAREWRTESGSLAKKLSAEFTLVGAEIGPVQSLTDGKIIVGSASDVATDVAMSGDVTIIADGTTAIGIDKVANTMLENMAQGTVKVGGASNAPTDLDASGNKYMLIGDGTDIASVEVTGDVTITNAGVTVIGADTVANTMLENITRGSVKVGGASDAPTDLVAKTSGQILVGDDTDIKSVAVSGDVALAADGEVTIASGVVTPTMTETMTNGKLIIGVTGGPNIADVLSGDVTMDATGDVTIATDSVENTMLANIARGSVKVGGVSDAPTDLDASGNKYMLVGDGTDINSVEITGDVTVATTGVTAITTDAVVSADMAPTYMKVVSGALTAGVSGEFTFAWQNPEDAKVLVHRVIVDITTAGGTVGAKIDVGVGATPTTVATDIFDDIDAHAVAVSDHLLTGGAGAGGVHKVDEKDGADDYITGAILTQDASSLAGYYYIMYTEVAG